jgi:hypothetical protein
MLRAASNSSVPRGRFLALPSTSWLAKHTRREGGGGERGEARGGPTGCNEVYRADLCNRARVPVLPESA